MKNLLIFTAGAMTMFGLVCAGVYAIESDDSYGETFLDNDNVRIRMQKDNSRIRIGVITDKTVAE